MSEKSKCAVSGAPSDNKPSTEKLIGLAVKNRARSLKPSELEAELTLARETLKKANKKLVMVEQEKSKSLAKVEKALKSCYEENKKLKEALAAKKRAEKKSEIEVSELEAKINLARKDLKKDNQKFVLLEQEKEKTISKMKRALKWRDEENRKLREALAAQKQAEENNEIESVFNGAKREINAKRDFYYLKADSEKREIYLTSSLKRCEEEKSCMEHEINRLTNLLKKMEKEVEDEMKKKIVLENEELRKREMDSLVEFEMLNNKQEDDYDVIPEWTMTSFMQLSESETEKENDDGIEDCDSEVDFEMWENFKIDEKYSYEEDFEMESEKMKNKEKKALLGKIGSLLKKGT